MGGRCIYCGEPAGEPGHLDACKSRGGSPTEDSKNAQATNAGVKRPCLAVTPGQEESPEATSCSKKPRPTPEEYTFDCWTCGRTDCPHSRGFTVFTGPLGGCMQKEFDPGEPCPRSWKKNRSCDPSSYFAKIKTPLQQTIAGVVQSKDFWSLHKYLGSTTLDRKIQTWMKQKILPHRLVEDHWIYLRRGVKEAIRFKRQECIQFIRSAFFGELLCPLLFLIVFLFRANPLTCSCPSQVLGRESPSGHFNAHLLQLGSNNAEVADLSKEDKTIDALAWVIRHFVPLVAEHPTIFWQSLLLERPLTQHMTTSDLAFAVLVLEHHVPQWQYVLHVERETGRPPTTAELAYANKLGFGVGLLYEGGIAGEAAKRRFGDLNMHFFRHFYNRHCPHSAANINQLQKAVKSKVRADYEIVNEHIRKWETTSTDMHKKQVHDDILHKVFNCMVFC